MLETNKLKKQKAHLIGICGAGMSALALLLKESGWEVTGSDSGFYEPILSYLKKNKIKFFKTYDANNIPEGVNLIVIGKHADLVAPKNLEVKKSLALKKAGTRVQSLPETLAELSKDKKNLIIVGSYGKSTCSALTTWCLKQAKRNPSYFIGAVPIDLEKSSHLGSGKEFVIEGDEYPSANWDNRSKFLHFSPTSVLLTSAEHDHKNVFKTEKSYKEPYKKLIAKIPANGLLVFCYDGKNNREIAKNAKCKNVNYSLFSDKANWCAKNIKYGIKTSFDLMHKGKKVAKITTKLLGKHNIENIIGVGAFLLENNTISVSSFVKAVKSFNGIKRRIELLNKKSSVLVYEGFGSSYAKAKSVFDALKLHFPGKRIITVFEPHTFSWRNTSAKKWYKNVFDGVAEVILLPPPEHGKNTHDQLTFEEIYNEIEKSSRVEKTPTEKKALEMLRKKIKGSDIIALISSGSLLGLSKSVPKFVAKIFPKN